MTQGINFTLQAGLDNYCVLGNPVTHSKSPRIHSMFAEQFGEAIYYQAIQPEPDCFAEAVDRFHELGGRGLNVTVPFKGDACAFVKYRSKRAGKAGAVNTIWFDEDGSSHGDTTDGAGLVNDLIANDIQLKDKRILILGAGGAVRGVLGDLLEQDVASIIISNRTMARAHELASVFSMDGDIRACAGDGLQPGSVDLIINGTSASLQGEIPALDSALLAGSICYDMVYADTPTIFLEWANKNGAVRVVDGLGMLVRQAAESFYIWRGLKPDAESVIKELRKRV